LRETIPYFVNPRLGFVQASQFYRDQNLNSVTSGAWEQQTLFFGAICKGKNRMNAVTMCGTNMVARRDALEEVGGMHEGSIAEDFVTGFLMHKNGWQSFYVPQVLAQGLAPEDFQSYYKQQYRWARGSLDLLFRHNLLFTKGITWKQRIQYLSSVSFFLSGWVVLIDALIPIAFFFTGLYPVYTSTMLIATIFLPYILLTLYIIQRSSNSSFTYRALSFSMSGFHIHISSSISSFFRKKSSFSITSKVAQEGNFLGFVIPQLIYIPLVIVGATYSAIHFGLTPAWAANMSWATLNAVVFMEFIKCAMPQPHSLPKPAYIPETNIPPKRIAGKRAVVSSAIEML
jgi:cellulose synthase (UDP-forming)